MRRNEILESSFSFSVRVDKSSRMLAEHNEYASSKQILKSGTYIGANIPEAQQAESTKDFIHKLSIANKEAFETESWIRLLKEVGDITTAQADSWIVDCNSLQKMLISVLRKLNSRRC